MFMVRLIVVVLHTAVADILSITSIHQGARADNAYFIATSMIPGLVFKMIVYKHDIVRHINAVSISLYIVHCSVAAVVFTRTDEHRLGFLLNIVQSISVAVYTIYFIDTHNVDGKYIFSIVYNIRSVFAEFDQYLIFELSACTLVVITCTVYIIVNKRFTDTAVETLITIYIVPDSETSRYNIVEPMTIAECIARIIHTRNEFICIFNDAVNLMITYTFGQVMSFEARAIYYVMCILSVLMYSKHVENVRMNRYFIMYRFCVTIVIFKSASPVTEIFSGISGFLYYLNNKDRDSTAIRTRYCVIKSILTDVYALSFVSLFFICYKNP